MNSMKPSSPYTENECIDHPLGILCQCEEYEKIVKRFTTNTIGTLNHRSDDIVFEEPLASAEIRWTLQKAEPNRNPTKPFLVYHVIGQPQKFRQSTVDKAWIPVNVNLLSANELRPNTSHLHRTAQNTQSADTSVLTDMLPHRGRPVKRKDIDWDIGSHAAPVEMTDEPETNFSSVKGCFSNWAEAYTLATGQPAY